MERSLRAGPRWRALPQPDGGAVPFDPARLNVQVGLAAGNVATVAHAVSKAACPNAGGWYDDYVTTLVDGGSAPPDGGTNDDVRFTLCPATCTAVQSSPGSRVQVNYGCPRVEAP